MTSRTKRERRDRDGATEKQKRKREREKRRGRERESNNNMKNGNHAPRAFSEDHDFGNRYSPHPSVTVNHNVHNNYVQVQNNSWSREEHLYEHPSNRGWDYPSPPNPPGPPRLPLYRDAPSFQQMNRPPPIPSNYSERNTYGPPPQGRDYLWNNNNYRFYRDNRENINRRNERYDYDDDKFRRERVRERERNDKFRRERGREREGRDRERVRDRERSRERKRRKNISRSRSRSRGRRSDYILGPVYSDEPSPRFEWSRELAIVQRQCKVSREKGKKQAIKYITERDKKEEVIFLKDCNNCSIQVAGKGRDCEHLQPFDLAYFLKSRLKQCTLCGNKIDAPMGLVFNEYLQDIIDDVNINYELDSKEPQVVISLGGTYEVKQ